MHQPAKPASQPAATSPAKVAEETLTRIVTMIEEIIAVMDEEVPLVEGRKRAEHAELLKRKQRLTMDYRASLKTIAFNPDIVKAAPAELRAKARDAADRLAEATTRNARILRAIMTASQRLVQSIIALVKNEVMPKAGYANMHAGQSLESYSPMCKPVTVFKTA